MKLIFHIPNIFFGKGGAEKVGALIANNLAEYGAEVTVLCTKNAKNNRISYDLDSSIKIIFGTINNVNKIATLRDKYDLLIGFGMTEFYTDITLMANLLNVPYIIQECTNPIRMSSLLYLRKLDGVKTLEQGFWVRQAVLAHANAVRFTVPEYKNSVLSEISDFSYAFYNSFGVDTVSFLNFEERPKKIVCVGALKNRNKNGLAALKAFIKSEIWKDGWYIEFFGPNRYEKQFLEMCKGIFSGSIHDKGICNDQDVMYKDAQLLIIPSFEEGLPNAVVEAFSYGVPAIGFEDCLGVNHLIEHGSRGLLCPRNDNGLNIALRMLANDNNHRAFFSQTCREFALSEFSSIKFNQNWIEMIENAIAGKNRKGAKKKPFAYSENDRSAELLAKMLITDTMTYN